MNAEMTAMNVLAWAADPRGLPPTGPLTGAPALSQPAAETLTAARSLLRSGAARMGAGSPPLGDPQAAGGGVILLAAAVGGRAYDGPARRLASAIRPPRPAADSRWSDAVARHLVVAPARAVLTAGRSRDPVLAEPSEAAPPGSQPSGDGAGDASEEPLTEILLRESPLTCVLQRPPRARILAGNAGEEVGTCVALLKHGRGRSIVIRGLSAWDREPDVLNWRAWLLNLLITEHEDSVVETYLNARTIHAAQWERRVLEAARGFIGHASQPAERHLAAVRFWVPLARLLRRRPSLLREHPYLDGCQQALDLAGRYKIKIGSPG